MCLAVQMTAPATTTQMRQQTMAAAYLLTVMEIAVGLPWLTTAVSAMAVTPTRIALEYASAAALILGAMVLAVRQDLSMMPVVFAMVMTQHAQAALMM